MIMKRFDEFKALEFILLAVAFMLIFSLSAMLGVILFLLGLGFLYGYALGESKEKPPEDSDEVL